MAYQFQLTLTNTRGGAWSVNEAGLKASFEYRNTTNKQFMMIREALGATVTVNDGQAITIDYKFQTTT